MWQLILSMLVMEEGRQHFKVASEHFELCYYGAKTLELCYYSVKHVSDVSYPIT